MLTAAPRHLGGGVPLLLMYRWVVIHSQTNGTQRPLALLESLIPTVPSHIHADLRVRAPVA